MTEEQGQLIARFATEYRYRLLCYAQVLVKDRTASEDIVQDVFREAILQIEVLEQHPHPLQWLMKTTKYKTLNYLRAQQRKLERFVTLEDLDTLAGGLDPEEALLRREAPRRIIEQVKAALTPDEYAFLRLYISGADHPCVAQHYGLTVNAVTKRLERIRKKLAPLFPEEKKKKFLK